MCSPVLSFLCSMYTVRAVNFCICEVVVCLNKNVDFTLVTGFAKTDQVVTCCILRNSVLKY